MEEIYDKSFFNSMDEHTYSARIILNILFKHYNPKSIVDVGCGTGIWLKVAREMSAVSITGVDGTWLKQEMLLSDKIELITHDLEIPLPTLPTFDLAISLEVAEHLPEKRAESFIKDLCNLSKVVLFSAAIPNQGGDHHINEQWQSYWFGLFRDNNYLCFDIIRHQIWNDEQIKSWYKQNCLVYVHKDHAGIFEKKLAGKYPLDIVHKDIFLSNPENFKYFHTTIRQKNIDIWKYLHLILLIILILLIFFIFFII